MDPPCDKYGATALQFAAIGGYLGIVDLLLGRGADVDALPAKVEGRMAFEGAAEHGRIDVLQFFLNSRAQTTGPGAKQYERARNFASQNGHIAAWHLLELYRELTDLDLGFFFFSPLFNMRRTKVILNPYAEKYHYC